MAGFTVLRAAHADHHAAIHAVRHQVFVVEQGVPAELERDALDPVCTHVLACDTDGMPIGTGRLLPDGRIGRMAVQAAWRNRGVGEAVLDALVTAAAEAGLALHDFLVRRVHLGQCRAGAPDQHLAVPGRHHAARQALEQRHAERVFQLADEFRGPWLGQPGRFGRVQDRGVAAQFDQQHQVARLEVKADEPCGR